MPPFPSVVELASGLDALYLSAQGVAPPSLFADLEVRGTRLVVQLLCGLGLVGRGPV